LNNQSGNATVQNLMVGTNTTPGNASFINSNPAASLQSRLMITDPLSPPFLQVTSPFSANPTYTPDGNPPSEVLGDVAFSSYGPLFLPRFASNRLAWRFGDQYINIGTGFGTASNVLGLAYTTCGPTSRDGWNHNGGGDFGDGSNWDTGSIS